MKLALSYRWSAAACLLVCLLVGGLDRPALAEETKEDATALEPQVIRDLMWLWCMTPRQARVDPPPRTLASFRHATAMQKLQLLDVPNVTGCGHGLPGDDDAARSIVRSWQGAERLVLEISTDNGHHKPPFSYEKTADRVRQLVHDYPNIQGVLLDDMTSLSVSAGFKAKHLQALVKALAQEGQDIKTWGVVYTMNMRQPQKGVHEIIEALDVINLWIWHARDIPKLESDVAYLEKHFPGKPIVLGIYLHDFGGGRAMPMKLLEQQCQTALKLAHEKRIVGMLFLTLDYHQPALAFTANWIKEVGSRKIGSPQP